MSNRYRGAVNNTTAPENVYMRTHQPWRATGLNKGLPQGI